jgi:predicted transcriptional regulator
MKNRDMVVSVLKDYGAMTSSQIAVQVNIRYHTSMTPAQAAGALRPLTAKGYAANSKDGYGKTVHWLTDAGKEALKND